MKVLAPFGFYGWGNIGDEATLQGFARLLPSCPSVTSAWVASRDPRHTSRVAPALKYFTAGRVSLRARWAERTTRGVVFPGGTPIMDSLGAWPLDEVAPLVRAAHDRKRPVVFVGTGTERLYRPESREIVSAVLTPRVAFWTVRSERDRERLTALGVDGDRVEVAADLAWLLSPQSSDFGTRTLAALGVDTGPIVGVNLNGEAIMLQKQPRLFEQLASFLDSVVEAHSVHVLFFCSEVREGPTFDKSSAQKTMALMRHSGRATLVPNRYWTPQELLSIIACCRLVVSTRYHPCLFAALQGVPFLAIQRSDKVSDLCSDLDWPFGIPLENVEAPAMLECVAQIERRHAHLIERLQLAQARQAEKSMRNQLALDALTTAARR